MQFLTTFQESIIESCSENKRYSINKSKIREIIQALQVFAENNVLILLRNQQTIQTTKKRLCGKKRLIVVHFVSSHFWHNHKRNRLNKYSIICCYHCAILDAIIFDLNIDVKSSMPTNYSCVQGFILIALSLLSLFKPRNRQIY